MNLVLKTKQNSNLSMLVYGDSGIGKTHLLTSALQVEKMCPILYFGFDEGVNTILKENSDLEKIRILQVFDWQTVKAIQDYFSGEPNNDTTQIIEILGKPETYKTVIFDNVYALQLLCQDFISQTIDLKRVDLDLSTLQDYQLLVKKVYKFFNNVKAFCNKNGIHHLWSTYTKVDEKTRKLKPQFIGSLGDILPGNMDLVGLLTSKTEDTNTNNTNIIQRILIFHHPQIVGANKILSQINSINLPTMANIITEFNKIKE